MLLRLFVAVILSWTAYLRTDGFHQSKIARDLPNAQESFASDEVLTIISQPFRYLDKGRQCFVFASEDGRYVLKLFNQSYFQMPWYSFLCFAKELQKRSKRRTFFESSYEIAFKEFGEEIVHLHMGPSHHLPTKQMQGPAHDSFVINLNEVPFILQRRGQPFYAGLEWVYQKEGMQGLYREIDAFISQIAKRISKHIADADVDVEHNWGYVDGKIFHLDPGRLYRDASLALPMRQNEEGHIATSRFAKWLKEKHYEEALQYLENRLSVPEKLY